MFNDKKDEKEIFILLSIILNFKKNIRYNLNYMNICNLIETQKRNGKLVYKIGLLEVLFFQNIKTNIFDKNKKKLEYNFVLLCDIVDFVLI
jgi:hypothetical protein